MLDYGRRFENVAMANAVPTDNIVNGEAHARSLYLRMLFEHYGNREATP